jgi:hypothetical protein
MGDNLRSGKGKIKRQAGEVLSISSRAVMEKLKNVPGIKVIVTLAALAIAVPGSEGDDFSAWIAISYQVTALSFQDISGR